MDTTFGFTFESIEKNNQVVAEKTSWGTIAECTKQPEYSLMRIQLDQWGVQPLHYHLDKQGAYFVESGSIILRYKSSTGQTQSKKLIPGNIFRFTQGLAHGLIGVEESVIYRFSNRTSSDKLFFIETEEEAVRNSQVIDLTNVQLSKEKTFDFRDKYWGTIETILNGDVTGKRIFLEAKCQSSLEYHCQKRETYFIHSGKVEVGLRIGRGENRSVILEKGHSFEIPPGLMHMRIGVEDSIIIEIATRDTDEDSHLVEDGKTYQHKVTST